jgi:hypothetical protein
MHDAIQGRGGAGSGASQGQVVAALDVENYQIAQRLGQQSRDEQVQSLVTMLFDKDKRKEADQIKKLWEEYDAKQDQAQLAKARAEAPPGTAVVSVPASGHAAASTTQPSFDFDAGELIRSLHDRKEPLVAALRRSADDRDGHIVVVYGAEYQFVRGIAADGKGVGDQLRLMCVKFFDPWADKDGTPDEKRFGGEHTLAAAQFASHCDFMVSPTSAHESMEYLKAKNQQELDEALRLLHPPPAAAQPGAAAAGTPPPR